ncbi:hypothetical protein L1987_85970 [Smallanthus sonchifolius]|uniref:Uncharacterized protein n=1 Tax=Smallanthus sonchifolius TaxID=185202 RepID=A0ACB8XYF5_9ASTR|nr:hypothetical protein L1987_85970 [Smallanthus sonchifolius]
MPKLLVVDKWKHVKNETAYLASLFPKTTFKTLLHLPHLPWRNLKSSSFSPYKLSVNSLQPLNNFLFINEAVSIQKYPDNSTSVPDGELFLIPISDSSYSRFRARVFHACFSNVSVCFRV